FLPACFRICFAKNSHISVSPLILEKRRAKLNLSQGHVRRRHPAPRSHTQRSVASKTPTSNHRVDHEADCDEQNEAEEKSYPARDRRIYLYPAILVVPIGPRIEIAEGRVERLNVDFSGRQTR